MTIGIITVSTTRTLEDDESGLWIRRQALDEGHRIVVHRVVSDDTKTVVATVQSVIQQESPQVILLTGGTGISPDDVTVEALKPMFSKELAAFGHLFAQLHIEETRLQDAHGNSLVLGQAAFRLDADLDTGWFMDDAHGCGVFLHMLPAWSRGECAGDLQIFVVDIDLDVLDLRHDSHCRGPGMDTSLRFGHGHSLYPVNSALELES